MLFTLSKNRSVDIEDWGLVPYQTALVRQLEKVEAVAGGANDTLIFCSHPPVVTLGRGTKSDDVTSWAGEVVEISRGGRATYHGPGQIVIYPILNLNLENRKIPARDLHSYLRALEEALIQTLQEIGLSAEVRSIKQREDQPSLTGVWLKNSLGVDKKVASIGIAVKKWVTYHGVALNFYTDLQAFTGIRPCGFSTETMSSLEEEVKLSGQSLPTREVFQKKLAEYFIETISYQS